ncbi:hypothetical protein [Streptomyces collinus]|uniref:hypothetical protein n=1 Tax=Streptomyces collinus TaxID=42684 RepID=UPI0036BBAE59
MTVGFLWRMRVGLLIAVVRVCCISPFAGGVGVEIELFSRPIQLIVWSGCRRVGWMGALRDAGEGEGAGGGLVGGWWGVWGLFGFFAFTALVSVNGALEQVKY